jgi:hypothetical protein
MTSPTPDQVNIVLGTLAELSARIDRLQRREDRARADAIAAKQARADAERRRAHNRSLGRLTLIREVFALHGFNVRAPEARADELEPEYLRRMCNLGKQFLPINDELYKLSFSRIPDESLHVFANQLAERVKAAPYDPSTVEPGKFRKVDSADRDTGQRITTFVGPESFIKAMSVPGRKLASFRVPDSTGSMRYVDTSGRPI